jgi:hypothetical protein
MADVTHQVTCRMQDQDYLQVKRMRDGHPHSIGMSITTAGERSQLVVLSDDDAFALAVAIMETANAKREGRE